MIMFRAMGTVHFVAGLFLAVVDNLKIEQVSSSILISQLVGGIVMLAIGLKFKL